MLRGPLPQVSGLGALLTTVSEAGAVRVLVYLFNSGRKSRPDARVSTDMTIHSTLRSATGFTLLRSIYSFCEPQSVARTNRDRGI